VNRLVSNTNYIDIKPSDKVAQASNSSFDAATFELWGALLHGAQLVGIPQDVVLSPQAFATQLRTQQISVLFLTTALFNQLAQAVPEAFAPVRHVLFGGEAADPKWVKEVVQHGRPERLLHVYGPTESTTFTSWHMVEGVPERATTIPIGRPVANTQVYILDRHLHPVPIGVPGELYIGGDGLARGYLNRPESTAQTFIPNPFSEEPGSCLYKTGDLARYLPDGNIEFLARLDLQVKLRGFRVELGEIESILSQYPAVKETVVLAQKDTAGTLHLVAYFVTSQQPAPSIGELRGFLQTKLPSYMVPSGFVVLDALPLTANGKVDRQALPAPDQARLTMDEAFVAPRDGLELQLTKIWEHLLPVRPIGIRDNFFELGGHSLLAVRLSTHLEKMLGRHLPLTTLFQAPTIEQLAAALRQDGWSASWNSLVVVHPEGSRPPFFCVHGYAGYNPLARHLGHDQPFYGLIQGLDGKRVHTRVEDVAAHYLQDIRQLQPEGPYFLGGHSFGGLVAFEMAHQLQTHGQEVALLVLIDPSSPTHRQHLSAPSSVSHTVYRSIRNLARFRSLKRLPHIQATAQAIVTRKIKEYTCKFYLACGRPLPAALRVFYISEILFGSLYPAAARDYLPPLYSGRVTLFHAETRWPSPQQSWGTLVAGGLEIYEVPGDHHSILAEPSVRFLAERLRACLHRAQASLALR
jgi:thioesterase domain-containing protein